MFRRRSDSRPDPDLIIIGWTFHLSASTSINTTRESNTYVLVVQEWYVLIHILLLHLADLRESSQVPSRHREKVACGMCFYWMRMRRIHLVEVKFKWLLSSKWQEKQWNHMRYDTVLHLSNETTCSIWSPWESTNETNWSSSARATDCTAHYLWLWGKAEKVRNNLLAKHCWDLHWNYCNGDDIGELISLSRISEKTSEYNGGYVREREHSITVTLQNIHFTLTCILENELWKDVWKKILFIRCWTPHYGSLDIDIDHAQKTS